VDAAVVEVIVVEAIKVMLAENTSPSCEDVFLSVGSEHRMCWVEIYTYHDAERSAPTKSLCSCSLHEHNVAIMQSGSGSIYLGER
jgi:hypothetical protein